MRVMVGRQMGCAMARLLPHLPSKLKKRVNAFSLKRKPCYQGRLVLLYESMFFHKLSSIHFQLNLSDFVNCFNLTLLMLLILPM